MDTVIDTHRGVEGDDVIGPLGAGESVRLGELLELDFTCLVFNVHDAHEAEDLADEEQREGGRDHDREQRDARRHDQRLRLRARMQGASARTS